MSDLVLFAIVAIVVEKASARYLLVEVKEEKEKCIVDIITLCSERGNSTFINIRVLLERF